MKSTDGHGLSARRPPSRAIFALLSAALLAALLLSLCCGSQPIPLRAVWNALHPGAPDDTVRRILLHVRLPRTLAALLAGGALALSGALIQAVLQNPMASPNVIGVNAGAGFFALLVSVLPGATGATGATGAAGAVGAAAFGGALSTALFIYALATRAGLSRTALVLAGVAVSSMLNAGINTLTLLFPDASIGAAGFMLGGFSGVTVDAVKAALPYLAAGALLATLLGRPLDVLQLGEESALSLGMHVSAVRLLAILSAALLAGAAVSFAGLLGFVGLLFPHIARRIVGSDHRRLLPAAALLGATFVLLCDTFARAVFAPFEFPVGIVMSLLGGPFFLYLLLGGRRKAYDRL